MAESTLFKTLGHNHHTDVLLLVENSQAMSFIWDDLRDRFLVKLMDKLKIATDPRANMVSVWVLESQPLQASSTTQPRQYHDPHHALREVCLNYMVENRISTSKVNTAIDFLASLGQTRALHLIIVATSSPVIDSVGPNVVKTMNGAAEHSAWGFLAERLAQTNIHCHTLTRSNEDITALTRLFDETLRLGNSIEDLVSFAVDPEVQIRLSMAPMPPSNFNAYGQVNPRPTRTMMPRRNTFPLDPCYTEQYQDKQQEPPRAPEMDAPPPSLVTQLQQVHGLTKKKVYGTKPQRKPFFKEDRVEQHLRGAYHHAMPTGLTGSSGYIPDATAQHHTLAPASGRMLSLSKLDRIARIQAGPTDLHPRRQMGWARRGSRLSSPEPAEPMGSPASGAGFSDTSPTASSYFSSDVSSPVSPASVEEIYGIQPGHATMGTVIVNGGNTDPTWLQSGYSPAFIHSNHSMAPIPQGYFISSASVPGYPGHPSYPNMTPPLEPPLPDGVNRLVEPPKNVIPVHVLDSSNSVPVQAPSTAKALRRSEPEAIINPVSPPPTSAPSSTKISTKKSRHKPEDDEYFELDQQYVEDTNNLFNEFFPNAGKLPESPPSGTKLASNGAIPPSSSDSSRPKDVHTYLSPRRDASGSTISPNIPPSSITNGPSASMKGSSSLPPSNASISSPSSGPTVVIEKTGTSSAPHGFHSPFGPPSYPSLSTTPVLTSGLVESRAHSMSIPGLGPYHPSTTYPSARGTSSLTGWAG